MLLYARGVEVCSSVGNVMCEGVYMGGSWIGIWCDAEGWELEKWADYLDGAGASGGIVSFLRSASSIIGGFVSSGESIERLREIEVRGAESIERKRLAVSKMASDIIGRVYAGGGIDVSQVIGAAGLTGWAMGREGSGGGANAGVQRNLTGRVVSNTSRSETFSGNAGVGGRIGDGMGAHDGRVCGTPAKRPTTSSDTKRKDREYASKFEAWAAVQLCAMGFKMRHVARGVGLDTSTAWRYVSAYRRHTKRTGLDGKGMAAVPSDWEDRLRECVDRAAGVGKRGPLAKRSGAVIEAIERGDA